MIHTIGITTDHEIVNDFPIEDIKQKKFEWYWIDIAEPTKEEELFLVLSFIFIHWLLRIAYKDYSVLKWTITMDITSLFYIPSMRKR